jgi:hypothetical protein
VGKKSQVIQTWLFYATAFKNSSIEAIFILFDGAEGSNICRYILRI